MQNLDILTNAFAETLGVDKGVINDELSYGSHSWDSVAHIKLIAALEEAFDIMIDTDDLIDMSSFKKAKEILKKYDVALES